MFGTSFDLVPRYFSIPAEIQLDSKTLDPNNADGPFVLGALLESLAYPFGALNEGPHRVEVPDDHVDKFSRGADDGFKAYSRAEHENPWILFNYSVSSELNVTCNILETKCFDPEDIDEYIGRSLDSEPIKKWLDGKKRAELYMITGFQVAKGLRATATTKVRLGSRFGSIVKEDEQEVMPRMRNDVIVSYRATKYTLSRRSLLNRWTSRDLEHGDWTIRSEPVLVGDDYETAIKKLKEVVPIMRGL
ncbi:unnamed protein product [Clonostachys solani]|uniref:Uncharacterized protein n=1 Tax=Clonostachys solani TaxID=160281 RepID=A0A9N9W3G9_9HYPO|nr:unnamed protein product [Clonostachys solani]